MAPADTPSHNHLLRSKRTRQAAGSDDSIKMPLTKKRRSALRRDTFEPLADVSLNEVAAREKPEKTNGHVIESKDNAPQIRDLSLRGARKGEKRSERGSGLLTLSSNDFYSVAQLPSLPDQIRNRPTIAYSCTISTEYDYILALTHTDALIWPYNTSASVPSARDLVSFRLPLPPATASDPLPLAAFTSRSANGEPGIVVISPKCGKVVYWENMTNATSFVPGQTISGVQGSIPGMLSSETVKEVITAEPAGFIITFSHGRVAHLTVRDQLGRPGIGVQFMRKAQANAAGAGIFGSIRNVFVGDRRRGTPIVRAGRSSKAQRDVLVATEDGDLEFWSTNLGIGNALTKTLSIKDQLQSALGDKVKVLDFEFKSDPSSKVVVQRNQNGIAQLVVLVEADGKYHVLELDVTGEHVHLRTTHMIQCSLPTESTIRPRLCFSSVQPIAFVLFETVVVIMSLMKIRETPSSQLLMDKASLPEQFQDCIRFQDDTIYKVLGFTLESIDGKASCVFAVQGFGLVRLLSKLNDEDEVDVEDIESRVGPKSKIEQAIFFGTNRQNPLDLSRSTDQEYSPEEVEAAVLQISHEILSSESRYLPKTSPSIENQMKMRSKAMEDLIQHALRFYSSAVSRATRFQLLWNSEKLAAAQAIWKVQEAIQRTYPRKDGREMTYLNFALRALHETRQKYPDASKGETDHVRHWLINSVARIDHLMSELVSCLRELEDMDVRDPRIVCDYLIEAVELWNVAYRTAFKFREDNAPHYGLGDEVFDDGVLQTTLPESSPRPWTSDPEPFRFGQRLIYNIGEFLDVWWNHNPAINAKSKKARRIPTDLDGKPYDSPSKEALRELSSHLPNEVELFSRIAKEENIQAIAIIKATVPNVKEQQKQISDIKGELRPRLRQAINAISKFNISGAIELAEKLKDPGLLVSLNEQYLVDLEVLIVAAQTTAERQHLEHKARQVQQHVETYFEKFGNGWAYAHFSHMLKGGNTGTMLTEAQSHRGQKQKYFSWFLDYSATRGQKVGKVSWINDIIGEQDFSSAQKTLEDVANHEETDIWAKKTEICLAKLSGLAAAEKTGSKTKLNAAMEASAKYNDALDLLEAQDLAAQHVLASVSDAIDEQAKVDLAMDIFGKRVVDKHAAFKKLLAAALETILSNKTLSLTALIDLLTLMDPAEFSGLEEENPDVLGHEFALSLRSIDVASTLSSFDAEILRMIVWRRAMIRDDWVVLNETSGRSDQEVVESMQMSSLFRTLLEVIQKQQDTKKEVKLYPPEHILTVQLLSDSFKTKYIESLGLDVASSEGTKFINHLEKDFHAEHEKLQKFVEKARLGMHYEGLVKEAERSVEAFMESQVNGVA